MELMITDSSNNIVDSRRVLYTPSTFARSSLIYLQEVGELRALKSHVSKRENLDSYLFFTVVSGTGQLKYDGKTYELSVGDCVFINCKKGYSHSTENDLWKLRWVHFNGAMLTNIYEKYLERGGRAVFQPRETYAISSCWENIFFHASSDDYIRDMRINGELNNLLTFIMNESWHPKDTAEIGITSPNKRRDIMPIKAYLDDFFSEKITLDDLEERFFINKAYMNRIFKDRFGVPINGYLQQIRITKAKQMLRFTDKTVEEIGIACGFGDLQYFSRVFKKVEGVSPTKYRKQW